MNDKYHGLGSAMVGKYCRVGKRTHDAQGKVYVTDDAVGVVVKCYGWGKDTIYDIRVDSLDMNLMTNNLGWSINPHSPYKASFTHNMTKNLSLKWWL